MLGGRERAGTVEWNQIRVGAYTNAQRGLVFIRGGVESIYSTDPSASQKGERT